MDAYGEDKPAARAAGLSAARAAATGPAPRPRTNLADLDLLPAARRTNLADLDLPPAARRTNLADLDLLSLSLILAATPDPVAAAAAAAACTHTARAAPQHGLWRALTIDARGVPDSRATPRGVRLQAGGDRPPPRLQAGGDRPPPRPARGGSTASTTRAAAADLGRWCARGGRGEAAESLRLAWHPAVAASAAAADAALTGCTRLTTLHLDAGPAGALAALPKPLTGARHQTRRRPLAHLSIRAASMDAGSLTDAAAGGPPPALQALESLAIHAALTGWAPLLPPPGRGGSAGGGGGGGGWGAAGALARLQSLELVGCGLREVPPALAAAPALTRLTLVGARLGRDRWSAAVTGAGAGAWSPTAALAGLGAAALHLDRPLVDVKPAVHGLPGALVDLELSDCGLKTVPAEAAACTRLTAVRLAHNALRSFSCTALAGLRGLRLVDLRGNALGAPLPAGLVGGWGGGVEVRVEGNPYLRKVVVVR